jgi:aspartyl-tRNA(Asn)/glutamyl-tRNA(Gln) amidotransferase subunit B
METRHWDQERKVTVGTRSKESEEDYRYFPDPNLPPVYISPNMLEDLSNTMPELPQTVRKKLVQVYGVSEYLSSVLVSEKKLAEYFEEVMKRTNIDGDRAASIIVNDLVGWVGEERMNQIDKIVPASELAELLELLKRGTITIKIVKEAIPELVSGKRTRELLASKGWIGKVSGHELAEIVDTVLKENANAVTDALNNPKAIQHLVGKVMEATNKRADPKEAFELISKKLEEFKAKVRLQEDR